MAKVTIKMSDWLRKRIEENIREGRNPLHIEIPNVQFGDDLMAPTKNGFVGPMTPVYGKRTMPKVLSLDTTEWRRL